MSLVIVDYNAGNLRSVHRACVAAGLHPEVLSDPEQIRVAERIVFPGVGHAQSAMQTLRQTGIDQALGEALSRGTPIMGICLGAQLILERSEESELDCLGWIPGTAKRFRFAEQHIKVPHIGWNEVTPVREHPLLSGLRSGDEFYFVHAYHPVPSDDRYVLAQTDYHGRFCCALGRDNLFAAQFHPEKSGRLGLELFERFSRWEGSPC